MRIIVQVRANAKQAKVDCLGNDTYKVWVDAPAKENKANLRLIEIMSRHLGVPFGAIRFVSGMTSKMKVLEVRE
ncbi:MAG: hypothetical protein COU11_02315 [Candidatus Harrisonbacteria bacterium CG10_big_fil_rev_8_21_14_0_10_49_15]|uniref:Uncharacterized protein n=1 Tax=Candidatus Harrisonbacteria bacterium CG10_big_fil_rev_8_21_14_0_10_49_15 TaxID=1974587 RepID=A0A2H0UKV2_9BACT|nr:MAG: hypothetical protein COU11_02315 [Candidatus Harrisonbacteria bacterium CG10_big_fil_rev_8_21_14_0_10_49_15]